MLIDARAGVTPRGALCNFARRSSFDTSSPRQFRTTVRGIRHKALVRGASSMDTVPRFHRCGTWHQANSGRAEIAGRVTMKLSQTTRLSKALLVAAALLSAPLAFAGPSLSTPEMKAAFAKAEQGPDQ